MHTFFPASRFVRAALCSFCLLGAITAHAQILLTVAATPASDDLGYSSEESYTFSFLINPGFVGQIDVNSGGFEGAYVSWWQSASDQPLVFTNISGSALHGTFASTTTEPDTLLNMWNDSGVTISQRADDHTALGLLALDDTTEIGGIDIHLDTDFSGSALYPTNYVDPTTFWSDYLGTHDVSGHVQLFSASNLGLIAFNTTSLTVTDLAAVPEPATSAALLGLSGLILVALKRRRAVASAH